MKTYSYDNCKFEILPMQGSDLIGNYCISSSQPSILLKKNFEPRPTAVG